MIYISVILLIIFTIYLIDYFINDKRKFELCRKFNGPWRMWIVGNMYLYVNRQPEGNYWIMRDCNEYIV